MPRVAMNYQNTIIYKIVCKDLSITECYVGSTTNFIKRKCNHKTICNNEKSKSFNLKVYVFIRANGGWNNWDMIEVERFPCDCLNEAVKRERYWYETLKASLNVVNPCRTKQEYTKDNKQDILTKQREYYKKNKDVLLAKQKDYGIEHSHTIKEYNKNYYVKHAEEIKIHNKQYKENNIDKLRDISKKYRESNPEKIREQKKRYLNKKKEQLEEKKDIQ